VRQDRARVAREKAVSGDSSYASVSALAFIASVSFNSRCPRSAGGVQAQAGNASCAALTVRARQIGEEI
jgi:hypothetical protein